MVVKLHKKPSRMRRHYGVYVFRKDLAFTVDLGRYYIFVGFRKRL